MSDYIKINNEWYAHDGQIVEETTSKTIAIITYFDEDNKQDVFNAALAAAAPTMLNLLQSFVHSIEHEGFIQGRVSEDVRAAEQLFSNIKELI